MTSAPAPPPTPASPPGLDLDRLRRHLDPIRPDLTGGPGAGPLSATLIAGGRSNLTYLVQAPGRRYVLRRPPLGHVLSTAHDMGREHRVISALAGTAVPVPGPILHCPDPDVIGAPFYLMEYVPGVVYRSRRQSDPLGGAVRRRMAESMMDVLAALHGTDPASIGLADFGRPAGFLPRQLRRWATQLEQSRSRDLPGVEALLDRLTAAVPAESGRVAIVHGDYRLDNLVIDIAGGTPRVAAVLDWEMATLGDPLADLGLLLTYWQALDGASAAGNPVADSLGVAAGFPGGAELVARYTAVTGTDVPDLAWYVALGCFKLAVICEGIHYRYTLGQTVGAGFDHFGAMVPPLAGYGLGVLAGGAG